MILLLGFHRIKVILFLVIIQKGRGDLGRGVSLLSFIKSLYI